MSESRFAAAVANAVAARGRRGRLLRACAAATVAGMALGGAAKAQEKAPTAPSAAPTTAPLLPPVGSGDDKSLSSGDVRIRVTRFEFTGNHAFTSQQLANLPDVKKYTNAGTIGIGELEQVRQAITEAYVKAGYINSGAVLPDQSIGDPNNAIVKFQIVEGRVTETNLKREGFSLDLRLPSATGEAKKTGFVWQSKPILRRDYVLQRIQLGEGPPLNLNTLSERLEILRQDPNVARINAELRPGLKPGEAALDVTVAESNPLQLSLDFNNKRSASVGAERVYAIGTDSDLTGFGDSLAFKYALNKGGLEHWRPSGSDDFSVDYTIPITRYDTTLSFNFTRSDDLVIENPFNTVNINSESESGSVTIRQPLYRTQYDEAAVSAQLSRRYNETFLLGQPFSFSPGYVNGRSDVTAIRLGQEFVRRKENYTVALRSTFSIGIDALGATTVPGGVADSRFLAWLGQAQYVRRVFQDTELIFRVDGQLANNPLPAIEQFSIGGFDTVRGYRENRLVRDEGVIGSVEWRIPVYRKGSRPVLDVAPFYDFGYGYNFHPDAANPSQFLSSAGVGLLYNPNRHVALQVYYAVPFKHFHDLVDATDRGFHFDLVVSAFE